MEFSWSEEQLARKREIVDLAQRELGRNLAERDRTGEFDAAGWKSCGDAGLLGSFIPTEYGGRGYDVPTTILSLEGLGYGCRDNGLTLAVNGQMWSIQEPILSYGTEDQKRRYLPKLCSGEWRGAHGMTEADSGSDAFSLSTAAQAVPGGYRLHGRKTCVGLAPIADIGLIFANTNPARGQWGISSFLVAMDAPGCSSVARAKMGLRTNPFGDIVLDDVFVKEEDRLGPEGAGVSMFNASMEWERSFIAASFLGAMEYQLERSIEYAKSRHQFGRPIGRFQSVSNRIADMKVRLETARLLLYRLAWMKEHRQPAGLEAAITNLYLAECFAASSFDSVRNHGALGYLEEYGIERDLRDAVGGVIYSGTSDIQRNLIARHLGL